MIPKLFAKNSFLKVSVSLGGFGPSVAHGKHSVRRRCVQATKNKAETCSLLDAIALMHVTSLSESYPLRNSLMGVRGFVKSFRLSALFSNDQLCSPWKGKYRQCALSHHRRRHPWGVSSRERPRRFDEEVTLARRGGLQRRIRRKAAESFRLSRGTSMLVLHRQRSFLALRQSKSSERPYI